MVDREIEALLDYLRETPAHVRRLSETLSDTELRRKKSDDEFSVLENVCHLRDIEREGYAFRIERILNEERPFLPDLDGARLARERDYNSQDFNDALEDFSRAREENVRKVERLSSEHLRRPGTFEGVGEITLEKLLLMMREHDEGHVKELKEVCSRRREEG